MSEIKIYKVRLTNSARKEFLRLSKDTQNKIKEALFFLRQNPYTDLLNIKKIKGQEKLYRIRIRNYRLIYFVKNDELVVVVVKIGHRREVYKKI